MKFFETLFVLVVVLYVTPTYEAVKPTKSPEIQKVFANSNACKLEPKLMSSITTSGNQLKSQISNFQNKFIGLDEETQTKITDVKNTVLLLSAISKDFAAINSKMHKCCNTFRFAQNTFGRTSATKLKKIAKEHPEYLKMMNDTILKSEKKVHESLPNINDLGSRIRETTSTLVKEQRIAKLKKILNSVKIASKSKKSDLIEKSLVPALDEFLQQYKETITTFQKDANNVKDIKCPDTMSFVDGLKKALTGEVVHEEKPSVKIPEEEIHTGDEHHEETPEAEDHYTSETVSHENPSDEHLDDDRSTSDDHDEKPSEDKSDEMFDDDKHSPEASAVDDDKHSDKDMAEDHDVHDEIHSSDENKHDENHHDELSAEEEPFVEQDTSDEDKEPSEEEKSDHNHHNLDEANEEKPDEVNEEKPDEEY
ncbi:protein starmaker-like [Contarinia nasturtii]|uniref:protein starmaker-like n=1 Tax=Contarinia nasturtii TaxID=265458 RepID=UPI0012D44B99|nr:protein starmaker-like [Contarinia nasturtii]